MPPAPAVKLQPGLQRALDYAEAELRKIDEKVTHDGIVVQAIETWLDAHEGKRTGGEKRPKPKEADEDEEVGIKELHIWISSDLDSRLKKEVSRRKRLSVRPKKRRSIVEAALIEWLLANGFTTGLEGEE
jgi:hypothetical protein